MARSRSPIVVGNGKFRSIKGLENIQRRIAALPAGMVAELQPALVKGANLMVQRIKAIAPVSELTANPGELRDSVHYEAGDHELAIKVVEDAVDTKGKAIAKHVEYGHKASDGSHVPPVAHFWPSYNVSKKKIRSGISAAMNKAVKKTGMAP